jgi:ligand-binding sensor domain-containing protein
MYTLLSILIFFTSCKGQNTSQSTKSILNDRRSIPLAIGDTVKKPGDSLWIVFQDKKNNYWFGSNGQGLYRYDGENTVRYTTKHGLSNDSIRNIQEDKTGNLYFTTRAGISKFDGQAFVTLKATEPGHSKNEWKSGADDLWFQGEKGPYRYDGKTLYALRFPKSDFEENYYLRYPHTRFNPGEVYSIYKDRKGTVWFGTANLGVGRYDTRLNDSAGQGNSFTWISEDGLAETPVRSIMENHKGNFWFGNSSQGLYRYDGKHLINFRKEKGIGNLKDRQASDPVSYNSIAKGIKDELWIATYQAGVWRYDGENVSHYSIKDGDKPVYLISIYKDHQGVLWLGTTDAGVYKFNGKTFERFR